MRRTIAEEILSRLLDVYGLTAQKNLLSKILDLLFYESSAGAPAGAAGEGDMLFQFGVTEVSLSFSHGSPPKVRCLAEVIGKQHVQASHLEEGLQLGLRIFRFLIEQIGLPYDVDLFQEIYQLVHYPLDDSGRIHNFRFALAIECLPKSPPSVKCYFDLHAGRRADSYEKLRNLFQRLEFSNQWWLVENLLAEMNDLTVCRGIGVDFSPSRTNNLRIYLPGHYFTQQKLSEWLLKVGADDQLQLLELFNKLILNLSSSGQPHPSMLVSLVFAAQLPRQRPLLKLDTYLPDYKPDDEESYRSIVAFSSALGMKLPFYGAAVSAITKDLPLQDTQRLQQYFSIDFLPGRYPKINVYFRPFGLETPHLSPKLRPRKKPLPLRPVDAAIRRAVSYLEEGRLSKYAEATHRVVFPHAAGFSGVLEIHEGRVFQTALICDALLQAALSGFQVNWDGIEEDLGQLERMKSQELRGGWKYFPSLPELPPDADDLAQVLHVFVKSRSQKISQLFDDAIELLLEQHSNPDGSLETWIVDRTDTSIHTQRLLQAIASKWGQGPDAEVMANLLYALFLYDSKRFEAQITRGIAYIVSRQEREGYWASSWYRGKFYGTFVCTRILSAAQPNHHILPRVAEFLKNSQRSDGGWGHQCSNPTDTALALLTVALLRTSAVFETGVILPALDFLIEHQAGDGQWRGTDFIQMDTNRVLTQAGKSEPSLITYRSNTITSAISLQALCAARSALRELEDRGVLLQESLVI